MRDEISDLSLILPTVSAVSQALEDPVEIFDPSLSFQ